MSVMQKIKDIEDEVSRLCGHTAGVVEHEIFYVHLERSNQLMAGRSQPHSF